MLVIYSLAFTISVWAVLVKVRSKEMEAYAKSRRTPSSQLPVGSTSHRILRKHHEIKAETSQAAKVGVKRSGNVAA